MSILRRRLAKPLEIKIMNSIYIEQIGNLNFVEDRWECWNISTSIGSVDLNVDSINIEESTITKKILAIFKKIELIDKSARDFLN